MIPQDSKDLLHTSRKDFSKIEAQLAAKFEDIQAVCTKFSTVRLGGDPGYSWLSSAPHTVRRPEGWWEIVKG